MKYCTLRRSSVHFYIHNSLYLSKIPTFGAWFHVRGGAFLPILEGVKHLPNPHILHFSVK